MFTPEILELVLLMILSWFTFCFRRCKLLEVNFRRPLDLLRSNAKAVIRSRLQRTLFLKGKLVNEFCSRSRLWTFMRHGTVKGARMCG